MRQKTFFIFFAGIIVSLFIVAILPGSQSAANTNGMNVDEKRESFISLKAEIQKDMLYNRKYKCCLEKPCNTCISLTPWHGEGAECDCLEDLVNGEAPCGECVGGILAGRGNPYLKEYFVAAIAEETGEVEAIRRIIDEKYPERL